MNASDWLAKVSGGATVNAIAKATKGRVAQSTLNTQANSGVLKAEVVIAVARTYGYPTVAALVELGIIFDSEARDAAGIVGVLDTPAALSMATAAELAAEIDARLFDLERRRSDDIATD